MSDDDSNETINWPTYEFGPFQYAPDSQFVQIDMKQLAAMIGLMSRSISLSVITATALHQIANDDTKAAKETVRSIGELAESATALLEKLVTAAREVQDATTD